MKRAQLVDWEWMRQETASGRQSARLPVVVKSGREASVAATEWVAWNPVLAKHRDHLH